MCLTFCHRHKALYLNHESCSPIICPFTLPNKEEDVCGNCKNYLNGVCGLTFSSTTSDDWCCHWNQSWTNENQVVSDHNLILFLGKNPYKTIEFSGIPYTLDSTKSGIKVNPNDFTLPHKFGNGTDCVDIKNEAENTPTSNPIDLSFF